jgi:two-component system sensor histidine kinase MprB
MSFRLRLIVVSTLAVAAAIGLVSGAVYVLVSAQLHKELDRSLRDRAAQAVAPPAKATGTQLQPCYANISDKLVGQLGGYFQRINAKGAVMISYGLPKGTELPANRRDQKIALPGAPSYARNAYTIASSGSQGSKATSLHIPIRIYTTHLQPNCALQVARPLNVVTEPLHRLAQALLVAGLGGIGLAAVLGWAIAGAVMRPVRRLTTASEQVARTRDLSRRMEARGRDELARLAGAFNTMLEALDLSLRSQRQLIADASHELRTPLTTAKTNVEVLRRAELPRKERDAILRDVSEQISELTELVTDIVDLARGVEPNLEVEEVRLDLLVQQAVERTRRLSPKTEFELDLEPCLVHGVPSRLERAIGNLLDNACKWNPPGTPIEVKVDSGTVSVRDHGPGIDDADLPFVFDRFYRAPSARALPGSGLGLAIVRQVAESHSGRVTIERPETGGTLLRIDLPCLGES